MIENRNLSVGLGVRPIQISVDLRPSGSDLLVLLHGLGCAKESFSAAFECRALRRFSICAFDFPGHGRSEVRADQDHSLPSYAKITRLLIERIRTDLGARGRVLLIGHSMGGSVGLLAAQDIPSLTHYISVEGNLVADDCGLVSRRIADQLSSEFITTGYGAFHDELAGSGRKDLRAWAQWYRAAAPAAIHQSARSLVEWSDSGKLLEMFRRLRQDKAYIYGAKEDKRHILPRLTDCRIQRISRAGHFLMVDRPRQFYETLARTIS